MLTEKEKKKMAAEVALLFRLQRLIEYYDDNQELHDRQMLRYMIERGREEIGDYLAYLDPPMSVE